MSRVSCRLGAAGRLPRFPDLQTQPNKPTNVGLDQLLFAHPDFFFFLQSIGLKVLSYGLRAGALPCIRISQLIVSSKPGPLSKDFLIIPIEQLLWSRQRLWLLHYITDIFLVHLRMLYHFFVHQTSWPCPCEFPSDKSWRRIGLPISSVFCNSDANVQKLE